jgi:hypothetical protein
MVAAILCFAVVAGGVVLPFVTKVSRKATLAGALLGVGTFAIIHGVLAGQALVGVGTWLAWRIWTEYQERLVIDRGNAAVERMERKG